MPSVARSCADRLQLREERQVLDLVLILTLLILAFYADDAWYVGLPCRIVAFSAIVVAPLRREPRLWFVLALFILCGATFNWERVDNHQYLIGYWCLALFMAFAGSSPVEHLRISARWLVALCFLFAVSWKVIAPDFLDGRFFRHAILTDPRFSTVAELSGVDAEARRFNEAAVGALEGFSGGPSSVGLEEGRRTEWIAGVLAVWTVAIELAVVIAFLSPAHSAPARARDALILIFVLSTYAVAPVVGFGSMLLVLGLIQASPRARWLYPLAFVLLQVYLLPWRQMAGTFAGWLPVAAAVG